jgi:hypothetical protein
LLATFFAYLGKSEFSTRRLDLLHQVLEEEEEEENTIEYLKL